MKSFCEKFGVALAISVQLVIVFFISVVGTFVALATLYNFGANLSTSQANWLLAHFHILFWGACFCGGVLWVLVDKVFGLMVDRWTEKRKREWNSRQHQSTPVE